MSGGNDCRSDNKCNVWIGVGLVRKQKARLGGSAWHALGAVMTARFHHKMSKPLGYLDNHVLNLPSRIGREVFAVDRRLLENY
jgi:hypothetical protein